MSHLDDAAVAKEVLAAMKERLTTPALVERCTRCGAEVTSWPTHRNMHFTEDTAHWNQR